MKKLILGSVLTLGASAALADDYKLVSADDSPLTQICLAAVESFDAMEKARMDAGLSRNEMDSIECNGMALMRFARQYSSNEPVAKSYSFTPAENTPEVELCIAAVTSVESYESVRSEYFNGIANVEDQVLCNGMTLKSFARKYDSNVVTAAR